MKCEIGMKDVRTGCPERRLEPPDIPSRIYEICDICGEPILCGEDCYDMPEDIHIHEDCLIDYAALYRHVE